MIIQSLLDTDLYKFTMMQCVLHQFPSAQAEFRFKCRTKDVNLQPYVEEIREEIHHLCQLKFTQDELDYLGTLRFIKSDFVDFLGLFHLNEKYIHVDVGQQQGELSIEVKGPWLHTILFEIPVLAIVSEVYCRNQYPDIDYEVGRRSLRQKIALIRQNKDVKSFRFAEYGTRRRFSKAWHEEVVQILKEECTPEFVGTSNLYLAKKYHLTPLGTIAHEFLQACQALGPRLRDSQTYALEKWASEYRGDLGIALSDVYGLQAFLRDFDLYFCKLFDGARHDSGDPFEWGEQVIAHYLKNRVDPRTKTLVFSDSLDFQKALEIAKRFEDRCKVSFGIGTNLTNDLGNKPLQMVMKMVRCNGQAVAKVSDEPEKTMCDDQAYLDYLRKVFDLPAIKKSDS